MLNMKLFRFFLGQCLYPVSYTHLMTVMLVGLVHSGIMKLGQTIGVIMGSNIGTTLTAWILSVAGIESDNILVNLLKPENFAPIFLSLIHIEICIRDRDL